MISADLVVEAADLVDAAERHGLTLRLTGSAAIRLRWPDQVPLLDSLGRRPLQDLDFFGREKQSKGLSVMFEERGYTMDPTLRQSQEFGIKRHIYIAPDATYKIDVFLDDLVMSHTLPMRDRLALPGPTVPASDLLLSKLQIHEVTRNDLLAMMALFAAAENLGESPDEIDTRRILGVLKDDWGFWYTSTVNLRRLMEELAQEEPVLGTLAPELQRRSARLLQLLEDIPKGLRWKVRAQLGARSRWYEEVGDVDHGHA